MRKYSQCCLSYLGCQRLFSQSYLFHSLAGLVSTTEVNDGRQKSWISIYATFLRLYDKPPIIEGQGKRGSGRVLLVWSCCRFKVKAPANKKTLLPEHCCFPKCFPVYAGRKHLLRKHFCFRETKNVSDLFLETFCFFDKCFPVCTPRKQCFRNSASATMFPRLRGLEWERWGV